MQFNQKAREIEFHADRAHEATLNVVKSVLHDPRISIEQKIELLTKLSGVHVDIVNSIHTAIESGCHLAAEQLQLELR